MESSGTAGGAAASVQPCGYASATLSAHSRSLRRSRRWWWWGGLPPHAPSPPLPLAAAVAAAARACSRATAAPNGADTDAAPTSASAGWWYPRPAAYTARSTQLACRPMPQPSAASSSPSA